MKFYDSHRAPNPRRVRIFLAEKGITVPTENVDIMQAEQRREEYVAINPLRLVPSLVLDDGTAIFESVAICRYFEEIHPETPLFGAGPAGKAVVEMWQRALEFELLGRVAAVFRHTHPAMAPLEQPQIAEWGEANRPKLMAFFGLLDRHLEGRDFVAGDAFSIADITGLVGIDFMKPTRMSVPSEATNVLRWHAALAARPGAVP